MLQTHETKGADFWGKSSIGTWFTTSGPQVDNFDFIGILESGRISLRHRPEQTNTLTNFGAIAARDLGYNQHLTRTRERGVWLGDGLYSRSGVGGSREPGAGRSKGGAARSFLTEMC